MQLPPNPPSYAESETLPWPLLTIVDRQLTAKGSPFETEEMVIQGNKQIVWKNVSVASSLALSVGRRCWA